LTIEKEERNARDRISGLDYTEMKNLKEESKNA
jgi:hypothetical protein